MTEQGCYDDLDNHQDYDDNVVDTYNANIDAAYEKEHRYDDESQLDKDNYDDLVERIGEHVAGNISGQMFSQIPASNFGHEEEKE